MSVVLDTNYLIGWQQPDKLGVQEDSATGQPILHITSRIAYLIARLEADSTRIFVPTPVLAEFLVHAGSAGPKIVALLQNSKHFCIADFDRRSAIEAATIIHARIQRSGQMTIAGQSRPKTKFDIQIAAIARVSRATTMYTHDLGLANLCREVGIEAVRFDELSLPPDDVPPLLKFADDG